MESDCFSANLGRRRVNEGAFEPPQLARPIGSLCWRGSELYVLLKRTFLVNKKDSPFEKGSPF
jgi:hypothetical protein